MVLLLILLFLGGQAALAQSQQQQQKLSSGTDLLALYSLRGSLGLRARDWPRGADPCGNWTGVACRAGRVVGLEVAGLRRTRLGRQSPRFAVDGLQNLTRLAWFNASGFLLPGSIPDWFGSRLPPGFLYLDLRGSGVVGQIPDSLGNLSSLTILDLSVNRLTGTVPSSLGKLNSLNSLNLSRNRLSGSVPNTFWSISNLTLLDLSGNNLTGKLPDDVSPSIRSNGSVVNLSNNSYYGEVPAGFATFFSRISSVDLSGNYFDGAITATSFKGNVSLSINCFRNRSDQRSPAECVNFYSAMGLPYDGSTGPAAAPVQPPPASAKKSHSKLKYILIGAIGGGVLLFVLAALLTVICCKFCGSRRIEQQQQPQARQVPTSQEPSSGAHITSGRGAVTSGRAHPSATVVPKINYAAVGDSFTYEQLLHATSNFSDENLIKHGHSGDLYQGQLEKGTRVVVKRIGAHVEKRDAYVAAELGLFAKGMNQRLVPFLGHCVGGQDESFLVYRFLPNGDLATVLHRKVYKEGEGDEEVQSIDWIKRLKIATGVAEALCYLHNECNPPIVHRDVQASSILLDDKFEVRLGSLSESCIQEPENHQNVLTRLIKFSSSSTDPGTSRSQPTTTCAYDVYCLGLVLLELVTGQPAAGTPDWLDRTLPCINIYEKDLITKIVDPFLIVDEDLLEEVWAMAVVAKSCLNPKPTKRPSTRHILKALENPLKVVREDPNSGSGRLRATSSRGSWNATLWGSWRRSSSDVGMTTITSREEVRRSETVWSGSGGSNGGERSFSHRRASKEIVPEPSGLHEVAIED